MCIRKDPLSAKDTAFTLFSELPITYYPIDFKKLSAIRILAEKMNTSVYDTLYHYLALIRRLTFYTADKKYYHKAQILGNIELVE